MITVFVQGRGAEQKCSSQADHGGQSSQAHAPLQPWRCDGAEQSSGRDGRLHQANDNSGRAVLAQGERNGEDHAREREVD
jgi:hypothetical protein